MDTDKLKATIREAEGLRLSPYEDTTGHLSIGYGYNLSTNGISEAIADWLLNDALVEAREGLEMQWPPFQSLDDVRQRVLVEMAYNLGLQGVIHFRKMLHALTIQDWKNAAAELLNSQAAVQLPSRYHRLSIMLESGEDV